MKKAYLLIIILLLTGCSEKTNNKSGIKEPIIEKPIIETTKLSFIGFGDALLHTGVYTDAKTSEIGAEGYNIYNFKPMFSEISEKLKEYDLKFYNQETVIGGKNLGVSNYPAFNSPDEIGDNLIDLGFNMVNLASNHTFDKGIKGAIYSADFWNKKQNILTAGSYTSLEERNKIKIYEKNNIKYAMLSYTYGTNGITVPKGYEYLINVWPMDKWENYEKYKEQVKKDIESVKDQVDILMVSMHFGTEYVYIPNKYQKDSAQFLSDNGVDVIIGTHPHVVQPVEFINNTLVIYSLGNFISGQDTNPRKIGGVVAFDIVKETENEIVKKTEITNVKIDLIWTHHKNYKQFKVIPFNKLTDQILKDNKKTYEEFINYMNPIKDDRIQSGIF